MYQIDQFVHTLQYGDAISNEALSIKRSLEKLGHKSEIYSVNTHEKLKGIPKKMSDFLGSRDGLILHYSISSPQNQVYLDQTGLKRFLIYHNLTPPKWFAAYNQRVTADLIKGKEELPNLIKATDVCLADSTFNAKELNEFGAENPQVLPLLIDPHKWDKEANPGILNAIRASNGINLLHVGRLAPNKCIEDIIKAFYFYHHKLDKTSRLWLVGHDTDTEIYSFELRNLIEELRLKEFVFMVGSVSDEELKAFYEACDLYLCMSEHEGFCVPLIEALHFKMPVIAFNSSAIPETLGAAGVLVDKKDPLEIALIIKNIVSDSELKSQFAMQAEIQLKKFSLDVFERNLKSLVIDQIK